MIQVTQFVPRTINNYTDEEKVAAFDSLYKMVHEEWEKLSKDGYGSKDFKYYAYEAVMELLAPASGDGIRAFWDALNALRTADS